MTLDTFLLIGLGNPGREYKDSRHNIGFMLIDRLAVRLNARGMRVQSKAIVTTATCEERKLILAKPQTYMNLSGQSVQGLVHFYKIPLTNTMILSDEGLRHLVAEMGVNNIVYGTDNPLNWPVTVDLVINAKFLSDAEKEAILGGNLIKLLRITS